MYNTYLKHKRWLFIEDSDVDLSHDQLILQSIVDKVSTIRSVVTLSLHSVEIDQWENNKMTSFHTVIKCLALKLTKIEIILLSY